METSLPNSKSVRLQSPDDREKAKRVIQQRGLYGLANDTKWDELLSAMRARKEWKPRFRCKCIGSPHVAKWDREWYYHLPFPMISVEWLDLNLLEETWTDRLPPQRQVTDHSPWIEELLQRIGFDYVKGQSMIRIFGYSPKNMDLFDDLSKSR